MEQSGNFSSRRESNSIHHDTYGLFEELQGNSLFNKQYIFFKTVLKILHVCVRIWGSKEEVWILLGRNPLR